jgi:hypothetical protein
MNASQRKIGFFIATVLVTLILIGGAFWTVQTPEVRANLTAGPISFLPVVMGVNQGPPPPPSRTPTLPPPTATATATATGTATATATATATPTNTSTPMATPTATLTGSETPEPPTIKWFEAEPEIVLSGGESTLSWKINGDFDLVMLNPGNIDVTSVTSYMVTPTEPTEYSLTAYNLGSSAFKTATVDIGELGAELLVYDWNGEVPMSESGFPKHIPPQENGDWSAETGEYNFEDGTFQFYVRIRSMPEPKDMQLQYCVWQDGIKSAEQCASRGKLTGDPGTILTWSSKVNEMWKKPDRPRIDWSRERYRDAVAIRNKSGAAVARVFDWSGEIPKEWFPLDWHFMVVVVEEGKAFSGWDNYPSTDPPPTP